jgi:FKBP-type peptidyl-prolyl cis-trans isomerase FklB
MVVRALTVLALSVFALTACAPSEAEMSEQEKISYALGVSQARSLQRRSITVNPEIYSQGFKDTLSGAKPRLTDEEMRTVGSSLQSELAQQRTKTPEKQEQLQAKNGELGQAFLVANKGRPDVVALDSGLQYKVIQTGSGKVPTLDDTVSLNYRGRLTNGKEFANTFKSKGPITFPVQKVIPGWREALQRMPVGSTWELYVPPELAYGERKAGRKIGPNSTLIFEVELLSIAKSSAAQTDERAIAKQVAERNHQDVLR